MLVGCTAFIQPGSPADNRFVESFHSRGAYELLDVEEFSGPAEARVVISDWQEDYNFRRPDSALGMKTGRVRRRVDNRGEGSSGGVTKRGVGGRAAAIAAPPRSARLRDEGRAGSPHATDIASMHNSYRRPDPHPPTLTRGGTDKRSVTRPGADGSRTLPEAGARWPETSSHGAPRPGALSLRKGGQCAPARASG